MIEERNLSMCFKARQARFNGSAVAPYCSFYQVYETLVVPASPLTDDLSIGDRPCTNVTEVANSSTAISFSRL